MSENVLLAMLSRFSRRQVYQWRLASAASQGCQRQAQCFSSLAGPCSGDGPGERSTGGASRSSTFSRHGVSERDSSFSSSFQRSIHTTNVCQASQTNFYDVLGVPRNADSREIKAAYYRLAKKLHPDSNKAPDAIEKFQELQKAYSTLKDPDKRRQYDQMGHDNFERVESGGGPEGNPFEDLNIQDIFGAFMGGRGRSPFGSGDDFFGGGGFMARMEHPLHISFMDAVKGCKKDLHLNGLGGTQRIKVEVEPGVRHGDRLVVQPNPNMEVILNVTIQPDKTFQREGLNVLRILEVDVIEGLLGTSATVENVYGKRISVAIPECSQHGDRLVVKDQGIRASRRVGDFILLLKMIAPKALTKRQKQLLLEFQAEEMTRKAA